MKLRKSKKDPHFLITTFLASENQHQYLHNALIQECHTQGIDPALMDIRQFEQIIISLKFTLKPKFLHQLLLFASHPNQDKGNDKKRFLCIVNKVKTPIDMNSVAKWLIHKLSQKKITLGQMNSGRSYSEYNPIRKKKQPLLPSIVGKSPAQRFETEISRVLQIFQKMERQRQNMGLIPIPIDSDDEIDPQRQPNASIPYDADFHEVNRKLFTLRNQAEEKINLIIATAKEDKKLQWKLQNSIQKYQRVRTQANEKIGRGGSMKAQKRMIDRSKKQVEALESWRKKHNNSQFV